MLPRLCRACLVGTKVSAALTRRTLWRPPTAAPTADYQLSKATSWEEGEKERGTQGRGRTNMVASVARIGKNIFREQGEGGEEGRE